MLKLLILLALAGLAFAWWSGSNGRRRGMPLDEARALLGVSEDDDAETVRATHRRLIARVHPDSGGTPELARRTNEARDVLLAELSRNRNDLAP
jgi:DnaJ homolog subfamily C member 19